MLSYPERMRSRARAVAAIRRFFDEQGFVEVDTAVAMSAPAPEVHLEAPAVELVTPLGRVRRYLQTSPELLMKRVLAQDLPLIYQIAPAFRDGDFTDLHRPEFRILEWYRRGGSFTDLMLDCENLLRAAADAVPKSRRIRFRGHVIDLDAKMERISVDEAFRRHAGFSILAALERDRLAAEARRLNLHFTDNDSWDDLFHRVFLSIVEPALLAPGVPLFLTHYPAPLASLARLSPEDARVAERFELYVGGIELANGFGELVDPVVQRQRFAADRETRRVAGKHDYPLDERFLAALSSLPPSAGIALGVDRLLMLLLGADTIDDVASLPWSET